LRPGDGGSPEPSFATKLFIVSVDIGRPGYRERHYRGGSMTIMPMTGGVVAVER
jgi:hypothetical protein